jgi:hypothetical protein
MTVADLVVVDLADENAELRERLVSLETDVAVYRELVIGAFDALRHLTVRYQKLQESSSRVRDEYQALREQRLLEAGADDDESVAA